MILFKNYLVTGSPWTLSYGSKPEFPGETAANNFGYGLPTAHSLSGLLFSEYRGLFYWSPVLLMAAPGLVAVWRSSAALARNDRHGVRAAVDPDGELLQLVRRQCHRRPLPIAAIPFLGFAAAHGINRFPRIGTALTVLSVALMAMVTAIDIAPLQDVMRPLRDFYLPRLRDEAFAHNLGTALGLPPLTSLDLLAVLMLLIGWRLVRSLDG